MAQQIKEYTSDTQANAVEDNPPARDYLTGQLGNAIGNLGNSLTSGIEQIQKHEAQQETLKANAQMAGKQAQLSVDMDQAFKTADPDDPDVATNFMQHYDDEMGDIGDNLETSGAQQHFKQQNANMRADFLVKSMTRQATLAGVGAQSNYDSSIDSWSTLVQNDPSTFDTVLQQHENLIGTLKDSGQISPAAADALMANGETTLAKAQMQGYAKISPPAAQKMLNGGEWDDYFNADEKQKASSFIDTAMRAKDVEQARLQKQGQDALSDVQDAWKNQALKNMYGDKGLSTDDILNSPLDPDQKKTWINMLKENTKDPKTDPAVFDNALHNVLHDNQANPNKFETDSDIYKQVGHGLTTQNADWLVSVLNGKKTEAGKADAMVEKDFFQKARDQIVTQENQMAGIKDPEGSERYSSFLTQFLPKYQAAKANGKSTLDLLSPDSPDYMGKIVKNYQPTVDQIYDSYTRHLQTSQVPASGNPPAVGSGGSSAGGPTPALPPRAEPKEGEVNPGNSAYKWSSAKKAWVK